jgi:hypothetical protein
MVKNLPCLLSSRLDDNLLDTILLLIKNRIKNNQRAIPEMEPRVFY